MHKCQVPLARTTNATSARTMRTALSRLRTSSLLHHCCNAILKRDVDAHHARVSVGDLGLRENLFVYFNIVCSQSKSKSSLLLLLLLSKEPIARKSFDSPRLELTKLDSFLHTLKYNNW
jgi:hypothetical protein